MESSNREFAKRLWGFLHKHDDPRGIESWLSRHPEAQTVLGEYLYGALTRMPALNSQAEYVLRERLAEWAISSPQVACPCSTWTDDERLGLGYETATLSEDWFADLKSRTPWLALVSCKRCGQHWYMATDTEDDDLYFLRLSPVQVHGILYSDTWPTRFDDLENVWPEEKP